MVTLFVKIIKTPAREQRRRQDFDSGGGTLSGVGLVGGPGGIGEFSKICKKILKKFAKSFLKSCVNLSSVWTKNRSCWKILKFFDKNSIEKLNFIYFWYSFCQK